MLKSQGAAHKFPTPDRTKYVNNQFCDHGAGIGTGISVEGLRDHAACSWFYVLVAQKPWGELSHAWVLLMGLAVWFILRNSLIHKVL